jgi:hypothetical protein
MIDLDRLCGGAPAAGLTLAQIQRRCTNLELLWTPDVLNVTLAIASGVLVAVCVLIRRVSQSEGAGWVVLNLLEGLLYGALAAWFGLIAGQTLALLLEPVFFGVMLLVFAVLAVLIMIAALVNGTAGGIKAVGVLAHLGLAGALVVVAVAAFMVPTSRRAGNPFESYLIISGVVFSLSAVVGSLIVSMYRGYHWSVGWLLVPINASWGALGNLLGLMTHFACLYYYDDWGKPDERRMWYVRYDAGFHLKANFRTRPCTCCSTSSSGRFTRCRTARGWRYGSCPASSPAPSPGRSVRASWISRTTTTRGKWSPTPSAGPATTTARSSR